MQKVLGVGINDYNEKIKINNKHIKSYIVWRDMLKRCYDSKYHKSRPTYIGCTVCEEWLYFSKFKEWYDNNFPFWLERDGVIIDLDKDLLIEGNKIYSPDTCIFIPHKVNSFMTNKKSNSNKSGYTGVCWHKRLNKWRVQINIFNNNKDRHVGYFANIEDAGDAYIKARAI